MAEIVNTGERILLEKESPSMIARHFCFYKFIKEEVPLYFIMLNLLAGAAAQMHMSGFFLFPWWQA